MVWEIIILVVLGGAFVVLKVLHSENERKRRMDLSLIHISEPTRPY